MSVKVSLSFLLIFTYTVSGRVLVHESLACENTVLSMSCPEGEKVRVLSGDYGRSIDFMCGYGHVKDLSLHYVNLNCHSVNALRIMRKKCKGLSLCEIQATNEVFGDPCPSTMKYAEATYKCIRKRKQELLLNEINKVNNRVFK